ncbi:MAG TPA: hypothetical protein VFJ06_00270 [Halococcus sp.]|nr:hypothetical protein [Halococcus sp.]
MTDETHANDGTKRAERTGLDLNKMREDAVDLRNAVAFGERRTGGRVSLELDHAVEDLETAVERLRRADAAGNDGGNVSDAFNPGDRAFINESDGSEVLVLATPNVRAENYVVPGEWKSIAEYNADYSECSPNDPVVQVVFIESIEKAFGNQWTDGTIQELYDDGLLADHTDQYAYPDTRLASEPPEQ